MTLRCPCCGQPYEDGRAPIKALEWVQLSPMERQVVEILAKARPRFVHTDVLLEKLYADDPNGGPLNAHQTVTVMVNRIRPKIEPFGWTIPRCGSGRGNKGRYELKPLEEG